MERCDFPNFMGTSTSPKRERENEKTRGTNNHIIQNITPTSQNTPSMYRHCQKQLKVKQQIRKGNATFYGSYNMSCNKINLRQLHHTENVQAKTYSMKRSVM